MENTLIHLIDSVQSTLKILKGSSQKELAAALHDPDRLPTKRLAALASTAVDLLHEAEQLLEPAHLVLADHFLGYLNSKCLCAAVELNIPDVLLDGPRTLSDLAIASGARADRLRQVMRVLHNDGIFTYNVSTDVYSNNHVSKMLLSNHWTQWRNWVELYGNEFYNIARGIPQSCRKETTRIPAQINYDTDTDMFTYFDQQGWVPQLHKTLSGGAVAQAPGILEDYPWEEIGDSTFLDIGGGEGGLVALVLRRFKFMKGGILELPTVISHALELFHPNDGKYGKYMDVGDRVSKSHLIAGDFLVEIPSFEVYTMKWCLHNWDDARVLKIMANVRRAIVMGPKSRFVIFESLLTEGRIGRLARYGDLTMMSTAAHGLERSELDWRRLAAKACWKVKEIYNLRNAWVCAIELVPDWLDTDPKVGSAGNAQEEASSETQQVNATIPNIINGHAEMHGKGEEIGPIDMGEAVMCDAKALPGQPQGSMDSVSSVMSFLEPWDAAKGNPFYRSMPDKGFQSSNFKWVDHDVVITNARPRKSEFSLDKNGFAYIDDVDSPTEDLLQALRVGEQEAVKTLYYPKVQALVKKHTGASRIIIFDHTVRKRDPGMKSNENPNGKEQPATLVHCDQSAKGAIRRLKQNIGEDEDVDAILKGRVQMINVWRPLNGPVVDWPLAQMDFQSLPLADIHPCDIWRHQFEERGQTVAFTYSEAQKWYYLDKHRMDEVTMLKIWDSQGKGTANTCAHSAFKHPYTPLNAEPRESVEVRCLVLYKAIRDRDS